MLFHFTSSLLKLLGTGVQLLKCELAEVAEYNLLTIAVRTKEQLLLFAQLVLLQFPLAQFMPETRLQSTHERQKLQNALWSRHAYLFSHLSIISLVPSEYTDAILRSPTPRNSYTCSVIVWLQLTMNIIAAY